MNVSRAHLAEKIAELMAAHQTSPEKLAEVAGVNPRQIPKWLSGLQVPSRKAIGKMADHFKMAPVERDAFFIVAGYIEGHISVISDRWDSDTLREINALMPILTPEARVNVELMLKRALHRARLGISGEHIERIRDILSRHS